LENTFLINWYNFLFKRLLVNSNINFHLFFFNHHFWKK
jgi:hypothetical protein